MSEQKNTPSDEKQGWMTAGRVLLLGLIGVIVVLGLILIITAVSESKTPDDKTRVNALAQSDDECVDCHRTSSPGIVQQYGFSTMAAAEVKCTDCHEVAEDYPGAVSHEGTYVLASPTSAMCEECHEVEVQEFYLSRHGIPAYAAMVGLEGLTPEQLEQYNAIPEAEVKPNALRNALFEIEGPEVTRFACESCHNIGLPREDGSVGQCQKCHLRHEFSLEQARKPETCNACHIGPDHPQWEIYQESPHGIAYMTGGEYWNWDAEPGTMTVEDFPGPTCATCHFSAFGTSPTTHDAGDRLTWYLFQDITVRRPDWEANMARMQSVCLQCHNENFITEFYADGDVLVEAINGWVTQSNEVMAPLKENGLVTSEPFDEPIDFTYFELWHHWGRTAKFGAWMQGPDYTQWHGIYELLADLAELEEEAGERMAEAGLAPEPDAGGS
ncbi:MAG: nitrate reductase [Anaerolineae bacterium]|nr:nitrate reductase [Anaerolineae bacterium]